MIFPRIGKNLSLQIAVILPRDGERLLIEIFNLKRISSVNRERCRQQTKQNWQNLLSPHRLFQANNRIRFNGANNRL
jgi:hypothetical protein